MIEILTNHKGLEDLQVSALLLGNAEDASIAIMIIDQQMRQVVCGSLRRSFPKLTAEDLEDIWADTLTAVLHASRAQRLPQPDAFAPYLHRVARAVDLIRRQDARERCLVEFGRRYTPFTTDAPASDALVILKDLLVGLPSRQRTVLQVFVDHFPESANMEVLRREVSRATGQQESTAAVKRALQEARRKGRELLVQFNDLLLAG